MKEVLIDLCLFFPCSLVPYFIPRLEEFFIDEDEVRVLMENDLVYKDMFVKKNQDKQSKFIFLMF